jgi:hypothetical protein
MLNRVAVETAMAAGRKCCEASSTPLQMQHAVDVILKTNCSN